MNGEPESMTFEEREAEIEKVLAEYKKSLGIVIRGNPEAEKFLNLSINDLRHMDAEQCAEAAVTLSQLSLYIQNEYNKHQRKLQWADENIKSLAAPHLHQYGDQWVPHDVKIKRFIRDNITATKLQQIKVEAQMRIDELSYIPHRIDSLSKTLLELTQSKRRQA